MRNVQCNLKVGIKLFAFYINICKLLKIIRADKATGFEKIKISYGIFFTFKHFLCMDDQFYFYFLCTCVCVYLFIYKIY